MRMIFRGFAAFCIATVIAQMFILGMSFMKGNLTSQHITKVIALLNGIDISGEHLQNILEQNRKVPVPTREEVVQARMRKQQELQMREQALARERGFLDEMRKTLESEKERFDNRRRAFEDRLSMIEKGMEDQSLGVIQRTLESLSPDQSKDQLLRFWRDGQRKDVVAILKEMPIDKRKKIIGEFQTEEERLALKEMLGMIRQGEPTSSLVKEARKATEPEGAAPETPQP